MRLPLESVHVGRLLSNNRSNSICNCIKFSSSASIHIVFDRCQYETKDSYPVLQRCSEFSNYSLMLIFCFSLSSSLKFYGILQTLIIIQCFNRFQLCDRLVQQNPLADIFSPFLSSDLIFSPGFDDIFFLHKI